MLLHWIWYALLPGMNEQEKAALLQYVRDPEDLFFAEPEALAALEGLTEAGVQVLLNRDLTQAREVLQNCTDLGIDLLTLNDAAYPIRLKSIADPPLILYYRGKLPDFDAVPAIGVVGTRKATAYGLVTAKRLGFQITRCGGMVISGAANGIDTQAIQGGLLAGGSTVAVMGCGVDVEYPAGSRELYRDICRSGCLISEFPPGTPPYRWNFPKRNRIISGLSCGVLVVEAPRKSGALITARHAREQGRDVFVTTGNVGTESCAGSNGLLRSGAIYADCGWDVVSEYLQLFPDKIRRDAEGSEQALQQDSLESTPAKVAQKPVSPKKNPPPKPLKEKKVIDNGAIPPYSDKKEKPPSLSQTEQSVLELVQGTCLVDDIIARSGMTPGAVLGALTMLEIKGVITRLPGKRVCRK